MVAVVIIVTSVILIIFVFTCVPVSLSLGLDFKLFFLVVTLVLDSLLIKLDFVIHNLILSLLHNFLDSRLIQIQESFETEFIVFNNNGLLLFPQVLKFLLVILDILDNLVGVWSLLILFN